MNGPDDPDPLLETLRRAQRLGFFGVAPMEHAVSHAESFVRALGEVQPGYRLVDIGSGGGLPGLVIARAFPHADVTLVDRRQKRTDVLEQSCRRLELGNVTVRCCDVVELARAVRDGSHPAWDAVTARGFGPPEWTLRLAVRLLTTGSGTVVISEPPTGDRWDLELLDDLGLVGVRMGPVRRFDRRTMP